MTIIFIKLQIRIYTAQSKVRSIIAKISQILWITGEFNFSFRSFEGPGGGKLLLNKNLNDLFINSKPGVYPPLAHNYFTL